MSEFKEFEVVCVEEEVNYPQLKIGKHFTVTQKIRGSLGTLYTIRDENNKLTKWIDDYYFKTIAELREEKLKELGI